MSERVPVTLLTGFLGAGKTTLVNRILRERAGERIAVVVNEFGEVGIDGALVARASEEVVELVNGCVCCTVRGDLSRTVGELLRRRRRRFVRPVRFDRLLVETSGLADPGPVLQTFLLDPLLAEETVPRGVVTLANATSVTQELAARPEAARQVAHADLLLLNHADRADAATLAAAEAELARRAPLARIVRTTRADAPLAELLELAPSPEAVARAAALPAEDHVHGAEAVAVVLRSARPLDLHRLKMWLQFVAARREHELWRAKGVLAVAGRPEAVLVQAVHQWLELGPGEGPPPAESVLVLIGSGLDAAELERGWNATLAT